MSHTWTKRLLILGGIYTDIPPPRRYAPGHQFKNERVSISWTSKTSSSKHSKTNTHAEAHAQTHRGREIRREMTRMITSHILCFSPPLVMQPRYSQWNSKLADHPSDLPHRFSHPRQQHSCQTEEKSRPDRLGGHSHENRWSGGWANIADVAVLTRRHRIMMRRDELSTRLSPLKSNSSAQH